MSFTAKNITKLFTYIKQHKKANAQQGFCNSGAKLQSSTAVLRFNFFTKLKICASIAPPSQSPDRCGKIRSAPFATSIRRITSASCAAASRTSHNKRICEILKSRTSSDLELHKSARTLCVSVKNQRSVKHIWFLPTLNANAEKPKELALPHASKKKYFRIQNTFVYLLNISKFKSNKFNNGNIWRVSKV